MNAESKLSESHVLAVALENLKETLNLSSDDLGKIIRVHRNTLSRQLKNKDIDPKQVKRIIEREFLNKSLNDFL